MWKGNGNPLQYSCLENPVDEEPGGLQPMESLRVGHDFTFTFTFHFHALEKEMATHSSVLAWRIPGTGEPCKLPSMGSHRVGHDWSDLAAAADRCVLRSSMRSPRSCRDKKTKMEEQNDGAQKRFPGKFSRQAAGILKGFVLEVNGNGK